MVRPNGWSVTLRKVSSPCWVAVCERSWHCSGRNTIGNVLLMEAVVTFLPPFVCSPLFRPIRSLRPLHFRPRITPCSGRASMESIGLPKVSLDWEDRRAGTDTARWEDSQEWGILPLQMPSCLRSERCEN